MSNLHKLQGVVTEMTSWSHHVTQSKHKNRQTMEAKDSCFCEERFIDGSFFFEDFEEGGGTCVPPMATQAKKAHGE